MNLLKARKVNNLVETAAAFSVSTSEHKWTVPNSKRWFLIGGIIVRDSAETVIIQAYDPTELIYRLAGKAPATGTHGYPDGESEGAPRGEEAIPLILDQGEQIVVTFGGAQGAGASISCIVLEVDV